jgi:hypothetical protein
VTGETIRDIHFKHLPYFCTHLNTLFVTALFLGRSRRLLVARLASLMKKCKIWLHKQAEIFLMVRNPGVIEVWMTCLEIMETVLKNDTVLLNLSA